MRNDPWLLLPVWLRKHFCVVKGHFCSFLISNIIDYLTFFRLHCPVYVLCGCFWLMMLNEPVTFPFSKLLNYSDSINFSKLTFQSPNVLSWFFCSKREISMDCLCRDHLAPCDQPFSRYGSCSSHKGYRLSHYLHLSCGIVAAIWRIVFRHFSLYSYCNIRFFYFQVGILYKINKFQSCKI